MFVFLRCHSLGEHVGPVFPEEVPGQTLTLHVTGDRHNDRRGVLLTDLLWIQAGAQVPGGVHHTHHTLL